MRHWWVNHKETWKEEVGGSFLWSPMREANGARSQFYANMRRAEPGDAVVSYANGKISHVGRVEDFAFAAPRPESFETDLWAWCDVGWLLPVAFSKLEVSVSPKAILSKIKRLFPKKYSPFNVRKRSGNQKAYFAEISERLFEALTRQNVEHTMTDGLSPLKREEFDDALEAQIEKSVGLESTIKDAIIRARRGQGQFRVSVMRTETRCRLTGLREPSLLVASHIRPWRACTSAFERLDGNNGLLLAPHVDRLFDLGLISFDVTGRCLVSNRLSEETLIALGLSEAVKHGGTPFSELQEVYLQFHRTAVFMS